MSCELKMITALLIHFQYHKHFKIHKFITTHDETDLKKIFYKYKFIVQCAIDNLFIPNYDIHLTDIILSYLI